MRRRSTAAMRRGVVFVSFIMPHHAIAAELALDLNAGYRIDKFNWNIAANASGSATPNILSELTWNDLRIAQISASGRLTQPDGLQLRAAVDYGWILDGRNQDSDYLGNNRSLEFSRSNNDTNGDDVWDLALALGRRYTFDGTTAFTPLFGLSHHAQNLRITNGIQTIPATGPFPGLDSTYRSRWTGPFVGAEVLLDVTANASAFVRLEYHWARFRAEANWNLRTDFQHPRSFEHEADGAGGVVSLGLASRPIVGGFVTRVTFHYQKWKTDAGIDRVFFSDGTVASTRLNRVEWISRAVSVGLERRF